MSKDLREFSVFRRDTKTNIVLHKALDANAAENAFADRAILLDENLLLFEQSNKRPPTY